MDFELNGNGRASVYDLETEEVITAFPQVALEILNRGTPFRYVAGAVATDADRAAWQKAKKAASKPKKPVKEDDSPIGDDEAEKPIELREESALDLPSADE